MSARSLDELQLAIFRVLWDEGEATAAQIQEALRPERDRAMSTISTVLGRLREQGLVGHRREGPRYIYWPKVTQAEVRSSMARELIEQVFGGDPEALVAHLIREEDIDPAELAELEALVARMNRSDSSDA